MASQNLFDQVMSLAKRRGFIYPSSEIYGGLANTYDYGPLGVELLHNLKNYWWQTFVRSREDIFGLETSILMNPKVWEASGHTQNFADALIECKACHQRTRADQLIESYFYSQGQELKVEGKTESDLEQMISQNQISCPNCGAFSWTPIRRFNLLFQTHVGIVPESQSLTYLRGETAQGMFVDFKQVLDTMSPKLPFGLAQSGKVFRNEITSGQGIFRTLEFDLAEFEYFVSETEWEHWFDYWQQTVESFAVSLGVSADHLKWRRHKPEELAHYSRRTADLEYQFPWGSKEWFAVAYRTDFDLKNHMEKSGVDLRYTDRETGAKFIPHVIEPTFGLSRSLLVLLTEAFNPGTGDKPRLVLKLKPFLAPYQIAVFPLLKNKPDLVAKARTIFAALLKQYRVIWDDRGNIGKRYYAQDEIGTPFCLTIDFDTLKNNTLTVRDRDTAGQIRVSLDKISDFLNQKLITI
jgi:glycyl-tRNA synthetase